jgi:hypothetical protein
MGALHKAAVLDADEIPSAQALGLPVLDRDKPGFALPCPRLEGAVCTIYGQRPRVCSRYKCQLLQDTEAGQVSLPEAVAKVAIAKELLDEVEAVLPRGMSLTEAKALAGSEPPGTGAAETAVGARDLLALKLRVTGLMHYLDKNFRNSKEGKILGSTLIGSEIQEPQ